MLNLTFPIPVPYFGTRPHDFWKGADIASLLSTIPRSFERPGGRRPPGRSKLLGIVDKSEAMSAPFQKSCGRVPK